MSIPDYTPDGKPIKPGKKPADKKPGAKKPSTGSGGSGGDGDYSGGSGGSGGSSAPAKPAAKPGAITEAQKVVIARNLKQAYNNLFPPGSNRSVPDGLLRTAQKEGWDDKASIVRWMKDSKFKLFEKTEDAIVRGKEAAQQLDVIFGENNKLKAAYVKTYIWGATMTWDDFLDKKVVNSKAFVKEYPGYKAWRNLPANKHTDNATSITNFAKLRSDMTGWYKDIMGDPSATISNAVFNQAMSQNIQDKTVFETFVRTSVPEYAGAAATDGTGGSSEAQTKAQEFDDLWTGLFGEDSTPDAKMKAAFIRTKAEASITDFFNDVIRTSDQFKQANPDFETWANNFTGLADASTTHLDPLKFFEGTQGKAEEFDDLWTGIYGADVAPDPAMRRAYIASAADSNVNDFFNNVIRVSDQFKRAEPEFEAWASASTGLADPSTMHVNGTLFFQERQDLRDKYDVLTEGKGMTNDALIRQAMRGRWSAERLELEFKAKDPNYASTAEYTEKKESLQTYWGGIFGSDSVAPTAVSDQYVRGNSTDVTSMFDAIKQTAEFQTQYGNWAEFQSAQDYAGNSTKILRDPAMYKQYRDTFNQAFAAVGLPAPPEFEKRMFASGVDPSTLESNLTDYIHTKDSYNTWTGEPADMATAAGIGNAAEGGDLRLRMKQALEAHKVYTTSQFATTETEKKSGLSTQNI